jgi:hypothetical protein
MLMPVSTPTVQRQPTTVRRMRPRRVLTLTAERPPIRALRTMVAPESGARRVACASRSSVPRTMDCTARLFPPSATEHRRAHAWRRVFAPTRWELRQKRAQRSTAILPATIELATKSCATTETPPMTPGQKTTHLAQRSKVPRQVATIGLVVLLIGAIKALHGCGGGTTGNPDALDEAGAGATGGAGTIPTTCEPAAQTGCAADEKCDLFCGASGPQLGCRKSEGTLHIGDACASSAATGANSCVNGAACLATRSGSKCLQLCDGTSLCGSGACTALTAVLGCSADPAKNKPFPLSVCQ